MECELHDVGQKCFIRLTNDDQVWTIGLSVKEELCACAANLVHSSELVVIFFSLQHRSDGHWVTPHPDLPLVLNGDALLVSTLLSHGSVIMVGDHTLTFTTTRRQQGILPKTASANTPITDDSTCVPTSPQPPPKPARHGHSHTLPPQTTSPGPVFESISDEYIKVDVKTPTLLKAQPEATRLESDLEQSMDRFISSRVNSDAELLDHINTPDQMTNVCSSYLFQFLLGKGLLLSTKEIDSVQRSMQVISMSQPDILLDFIIGMKNKDSIGDHDLYLRMISDVLLTTMDHEDSTETYMKVLAHMSGEPEIARYLGQHRMVPVASACSAVYPNNVQIQIMMCRLHGSVVKNHNGGMCPVKEAAVDLIVRSMGIHQEEILLLVDALRTLCQIARLYAVPDGSGYVMRQSNSVLCHMEEHAKPVVQTLYNSRNDREILDMCVEIMDILLKFYTDGISGVIDPNERSDSPKVCNTNSAFQPVDIMDSNYSNNEITSEMQKFSTERNEKSSGEEDDISSQIYTKVTKTRSKADTTTSKLESEDAIFSSLNFNSDSNSKHELSDREADDTYEDVIDKAQTGFPHIDDMKSEHDEQEWNDEDIPGETSKVFQHPSIGDSVTLIDNDLYEDLDSEYEYEEEEQNDMTDGQEDSHTESEHELLFENSTKGSLKDVQESVISDQDEVSKTFSNKHKLKEEISGTVKPKAKKTAFIKKKLGGYFSKLKPRKRKGKHKLTDGLAFTDGSKSPVQFEQFDNSIDIAFNHSTMDADISTNTLNSSDCFDSPIYSDPNSECADQSTTILPHSVDDERCDSSSMNSEFELPAAPHSDSDSIESEFRLSPGVHGLDHDQSDSEEEPEFPIDAEDNFVPFSESQDEMKLQRCDASEPVYLDIIPQVESDVHTDNKEPMVYISSASYVASSSPGMSTAEDVIPDSRSEYSEVITQSMTSRAGKNVPWVSTLKQIYEKPTSKLKNAVGVGKKVGFVANPKYGVGSKDGQVSKVLPTQYRSTENLSSVCGIDEEEFSGTESEHAERYAQDLTETNRGNGGASSKQSDKLSKFEVLKQKNLREKQRLFPWTSTPKS